MTDTPHFVLFSVMGPHAGETAEDIFKRKIDDLRNVGITFWVVSSHKANPNIVHDLCAATEKRDESVSCYFLEPSSRGGAVDTKSSIAAQYFSSDRVTWNELPTKLSPVTGRIAANSCALVFDELTLLDSVSVVDLWEFAEFSDAESPVRFGQGMSTVCALRKSTNTHVLKMKSNLRRVVAVGKLVAPYAVWLR